MMAKILIIDDDPLTLEEIADLLASTGHQVTTGKTAKNAQKLLSDQTFDLVITEIIMPEMDGFEFLIWLRRRSGRPKTIAMSGGSAKLEKQAVLGTARLMADGILQKPVTHTELDKMVRELFEVNSTLSHSVDTVKQPKD